MTVETVQTVGADSKSCRWQRSLGSMISPWYLSLGLFAVSSTRNEADLLLPGGHGRHSSGATHADCVKHQDTVSRHDGTAERREIEGGADRVENPTQELAAVENRAARRSTRNSVLRYSR